MLAVGDSIIAGVGAGHISNALAGRTASALAASLGATVHWQALGGIGYRAQKIIDELLPAMPPEPADFIIVSVGVNDITGLTSLRNWRSRLGLLLERLREHSPDAAIAVAGVPPLGLFPLLPQPLRSVAGLRAETFEFSCREVVSTLPNCIHVPVAFDFSPDKFAADGYHPSEESYRSFGEEMANGLLRVNGLQENEPETQRRDRD
jgi:lysophospholipase L1-like esterase